MKNNDSIRLRMQIFRQKHPEIYILIFIILCNMSLFAISLGVSYVFSGGGMSIQEIAIMSFKWIIDPGAFNEDYGILSLIGGFVVIFGLIIFTGGTIGYLSNIINEYVASSRENIGKIKLKNHIVILNWNDNALDIIYEYSMFEEKIDVAVLTDHNGSDIMGEIKSRWFDDMRRLKDEEERIKKDIANDKFATSELVEINGLLKERKKQYYALKKMNTFIKYGDINARSDLNEVSIDDAKAVLILCDESYENSMKIIKVLMQISTSLDKKTIVIEVRDEQLFKTIITFRKNHKKNDIIPIMVDKQLGKIIAQSIINKDLHKVYSELFSFEGAEIYTNNIDPNHRIGLSNEQYLEKLMLSHDNAIPLFVGMEKVYWLSTGTGDVLSMRDDKEIKKVTRDSIDFQPLIGADMLTNVLVIGTNSKTPYIIDTVRAFVEQNINTKVNVTMLVNRDELDCINCGLEEDWIRIVECTYNIVNPEQFRKQLHDLLEAEAFDVFLILPQEDRVKGEKDADALLYLLHAVNEINATEGGQPKTIIELLNPKDKIIARSFNADGVTIIGSKYIAKMIAQISLNNDLYGIYIDILNYDNQDFVDEWEAQFNEGGREVYVLKARSVFKTLPLRTTVGELVVQAYRKHNIIPIGRIKNYSKFKAPLFKNGLDEEIEITEEDSLVLFMDSI